MNVGGSLTFNYNALKYSFAKSSLVHEKIASVNELNSILIHHLRSIIEPIFFSSKVMASWFLYWILDNNRTLKNSEARQVKFKQIKRCKKIVCVIKIVSDRMINHCRIN